MRWEWAYGTGPGAFLGEAPFRLKMSAFNGVDNPYEDILKDRENKFLEPALFQAGDFYQLNQIFGLEFLLLFSIPLKEKVR